MDDQLVSLETQKSHYEDLIGSNPDWVFAGLYYDEGISGTSKEKRPALQRMIADCEAGRIDRILTKSLSRFARNTTDCLELTRKLLDLGITIFFEKENLDTGSMESELLLSIMSSLAESESVSISENSKWSVRHRFENGTFKIASAPFGYRNKDGEMVINEEEAKWVRWIFEQAVNGIASHEIARQLQANQVPTRKTGTGQPQRSGGC
jgi:DNA invertase Pin-like site-specific DNA recombinase